mgnify:CR=1 FL=1
MPGLFKATVGTSAGHRKTAPTPNWARPRGRGCWSVRKRACRAYNTLAVVDTLTKRFEEKDMLSEAEILAARAPAAPTPDAVTNKSRKARKITRNK